MYKQKYRIYYEDTDAGGIVYHANYLKFLERSRTDFLRSLKIKQSDLMQENLAFVVKKISIDYIKPAFFDDLLEVQTSIDKISKAGVYFLQNVYDQNNNLIISANVIIVSIDLKLKKIKFIPKEIREVIAGAN